MLPKFSHKRIKLDLLLLGVPLYLMRIMIMDFGGGRGGEIQIVCSEKTPGNRADFRKQNTSIFRHLFLNGKSKFSMASRHFLQKM